MLISNKELLNSREVIKFLGLNKLCPELLINCPQMLIAKKEELGYYVKIVKFLPKYNIFLTCSNCKKT